MARYTIDVYGSVPYQHHGIRARAWFVQISWRPPSGGIFTEFPKRGKALTAFYEGELNAKLEKARMAVVSVNWRTEFERLLSLSLSRQTNKIIYRPLFCGKLNTCGIQRNERFGKRPGRSWIAERRATGIRDFFHRPLCRRQNNDRRGADEALCDVARRINNFAGR